MEQCGTPESEIPAPPPSYPLILDKDPVPEELVRSNVNLSPKRLSSHPWCPPILFLLALTSVSPTVFFDQEWEAYVSDSDSDGEGRGSWSDMLSPEERERQRREREESRRVLSELKAVLGFRASEGERMKRKQLLFNDQGLGWYH